MGKSFQIVNKFEQDISKASTIDLTMSMLLQVGHNSQWANNGCVITFVALPFTLKSILRQKKKNYGNSNISPSKKL
jgi:hypothetical protein